MLLKCVILLYFSGADPRANVMASSSNTMFGQEHLRFYYVYGLIYTLGFITADLSIPSFFKCTLGHLKLYTACTFR